MVRIKPEAQRPHEPQFGAERRTRAAGIARVLRDLRFVQHNMQYWRFGHNHEITPARNAVNGKRR